MTSVGQLADAADGLVKALYHWTLKDERAKDEDIGLAVLGLGRYGARELNHSLTLRCLDSL